jgi:rubrerythrin
MSTSGIEFSTLTLHDALDLAILVDEEAEERYQELADQLELHHTEEAAAFLHRMSSEEGRQATELRQRRQQLFPDAERKVGPPALWDVKTPGYDEVHVFMTLREAMQVALGAEEKAEAFFEAALHKVRDEEVAVFFRQLRAEEARLREQVERDMAALPPEPQARPEDFADEPVEQ